VVILLLASYARPLPGKAQIERGHAERDRLAARVRELEAALTAFVEAEDINRQYDGTYDSPPGHVVAEMYERAAAMARAALADSGAGGEEA
jgi:hypothetical protein